MEIKEIKEEKLVTESCGSGLSSEEIGACIGIVCTGINGLSKKYQAVKYTEGGLGLVMAPSTWQKQMQILLEETTFMFSLKKCPQIILQQ